MSSKADRIRWLAEWSAERRAMRDHDARLIRATAIGRPVEFRSKVGRCPPKRRKAEALAKEQGGACYLCGELFKVMQRTPTLDHVEPKDRGGRNRGNLLAACQPCNLRKGNRAPRPCEMLFLIAINSRLLPRRGRLPSRPWATEAAALL